MSYYSAAPVVASGKMKLWAGCNVPVLGYRYTEVDVEVFWIRKSELEVEFMHGGKSVKRLGTFNDFYCFMGSVQCIEDAKEAAAAYGVDSGSTAEIVATLRVFDEPNQGSDPRGHRAQQAGRLGLNAQEALVRAGQLPAIGSRSRRRDDLPDAGGASGGGARHLVEQEPGCRCEGAGSKPPRRVRPPGGCLK